MIVVVNIADGKSIVKGDLFALGHIDEKYSS